MKLLDPFAGYRLASGHAFFHIALFGCSFFIKIEGANEESVQGINEAFYMLRYGHLVLIILAMIETWAQSPSSVPDLN